MIDILTSGREILGSAVTSRLQTYLDNYGTGIRLVTLNVESTSPPDAVQDAFDDVIRAREDRQRTINQAMAYANAIIPAAQGQAQRIVEQGQGYRESVVAEARGQANRFTALLTQYRNAPEVMRERLYLDAISEVLGQTNKVLVDVDQDGPLMVLPMDRIGRGLGTSTAADAENQLDPQVLERIRAESANAASNSSSNRNGRDTGIQREGR